MAPSAALHHQFDRLFYLTLIGIALFDDRQRHAMGAEYDLRAARFGEAGQRFVNLLDQ